MIGTYVRGNFSVAYTGAMDYEEIVVDATVGGVSLTAEKVNAADSVFIQVGDGPVRITVVNGLAPTSTFGQRFWDGDNADMAKLVALRMRAIRDSVATGNGVIRAVYYKRNST
jgi:hypothetical protein